jgi:hypothetical protein
MHDNGTNAPGVQLTMDGSLVRNGPGEVAIQVGVDVPGTLRSISGSIAFYRAVSTTGRVEGTSTVNFQNATLANSAVFAPGVSPGTLTFVGNYSNASLEIEVGGLLAGEVDRLAVSGTAALAGSLAVSLVDGFQTAIGHEFEILTFASGSGEFDVVTVNGVDPSQQEMVVQYGPTSVKLVVLGANNPPVAIDDVRTTDEDTATTIDVLLNDADADNDTLRVKSVTDPPHGTAEIVDNAVTYTPDENYFGSDSLSYIVADERGAEAIAKVRITVRSVNDAPTAAVLLTPPDGASVVVEGEPENAFVVTWKGSTDVEGDPIAHTWQLALDAGFATVIASIDVGTATLLQTMFGEIATLLTANGVSLDEAATLYHRVVTSDGTDEVEGASFSITLTRGSIVANEPVQDLAELPTEFALRGNYPNPFNPVTTIEYDVPSERHVTLAVYDALGRAVSTLVDEAKPAGVHRAVFRADGLPSGLYLYRLTAGDFTATRTMVVLK